MRKLIPLIILVISGSALAAGKNYPHPAGPPPGTVEPAYCKTTELKKLEIKPSISGLSNAHVYKIGSVTFAGLGVGNSNSSSVVQLSGKYSSTIKSEGYCTWYFNNGNSEAEKLFNWNYVPRPNSDPKKAVQEYAKVLNNLDTDKNNMVACAETRGYISLGCDGMKHRGPSVAAMLLAYSGCSPESAVGTAIDIWGTNGISTDSRLALAREAAKRGAANPEKAKRLQDLFLGKAH